MSAPLRIALLGTGNVGRALIDLVDARRDAGLALVHVANSRAEWRDPLALPAQVVVDATASDEIAARHADWLARGVHVVTANKLGQGASLARWQAIDDACVTSGAQYGDSATVGAGLPLLLSLRALRRGGDAIASIAGVLSGSMAWLLAHHDGARPFSQLVREARAAGYTEPDPRIDLRGEDVRRKLLILARAAGVPLEADEVQVEALSTPTLDVACTAGDIAHVLDKRTVAEQAETVAQLDTLRAMGVDYAQGYAISRPQPIDALFADTEAARTVPVAT